MRPRKFVHSTALMLVLTAALTVTAFAADPTQRPANETDNKSSYYPTSVEMTEDDAGNPMIRKTYQLSVSDDPQKLPVADFERDGRRYYLLDMTKEDEIGVDTKEHSETVKLSSDTKEMEQILQRLDAQKEVTTEDGHTGVLTLDHTSVKVDGLGFISMEAVDLMTLVSQVALGFIAFAIGNEFRLEEITHIGRQAVVVGVFQGLAAMLCVDTALLLLHIFIPDKLSVAQAITLGAISTATAPAATLMVVRQYKASGPLTDLLLPVVALDDAVGLVAFAISFGIARTLSSGVVDFVSILVDRSSKSRPPCCWERSAAGC